MVDESKLFTAVLLQPVNILLFSVKSIGSTHTTEEPSACVKIMSEFRGSCVIFGQSHLLPCCKKLKNTDVTDRKTDSKNKKHTHKNTGQ